MRHLGTVVLALAAALSAGGARGWSGHALCTWQALSVMPQVNQPRVRVETLEAFLSAQAPRVQAALDEAETWARANVPDYAARPDALAFRVDAAAPDLRARFLNALRINPAARLPLFVQLRPGNVGHATLAWERITTLKGGAGAREHRFAALEPGDELPALEVVATASNEPDYGLDLGLWDDSHAEVAPRFGFGRQPFGNPAVTYSGQAPFHMGFFHESRIVYLAAGFLKRTYPELRVQQFSALARVAFAQGHAYWGWRFTGWALHYVQDLTQPYHARVLPGVSTARMLWINALDKVGSEQAKNDAINLVTNRHTVVEAYQFRRMQRAYERSDYTDLLLVALRDDASDDQHRVYQPSSTRQRVALESAAAADELDAQLARTFPASYVSDPKVVISGDTPMPDLHALLSQGPQAEHDELAKQLARLLGNLGRHSRALVRAILGLS
ncbi:MAG: hypothetical protein ACKVQR_18360 [Aquabacterium sp.]